MEIKAIVLKNTADKLSGLIGKKPSPVYFETRYGIHTFFMKYPVDVIILNSSGRVVKFKEMLKPWNIFIWNPKYSRVLELPGGFIARSGIKTGETIKIIPD